ncbi:MAG: hypothetical protein HYV97_19950 [Bdellovibrio sp.]|nr:hypothetical protein [Bdellovibrio sp.]
MAMIILKDIFIICIMYVSSFCAWSASIPSYENIQNCQCDKKFQTHFFKDSQNKSEIQISKARCECNGKKQDVTAICPTKKRALKKFMICAQDATISAEMSPPEKIDSPSNTEGSPHESQTR